MKYLALIGSLALLFLNGSAVGQIKVSGLVTDFSNHQPLIGASIAVENTTDGTVTNSNGQFSIALDQAGVLLVSYTGYESTRFEVIKDIELNIELKKEVNQLKVVEIAAAQTIELQLPASHMKIPKAHLERDNGTSIAPALNRVTGVLMHSGALNTNRITIRGVGNRSPFSTTKIRAYLDDIPLTTGDGETTIEDIDLSLIQGVDVWKGPTASSYGAGLGGMIHLKTKSKKDLVPTTLTSSQTVGSFGLLRNVSTANFTNPKKTLHVGINYNTTHQDGYRENNQFDREAVTLIAKQFSRKGGETTLFGNFTTLKAFIPSSLNREDFENRPQTAAFSWKQVQGFEDYDKAIFGLSHKLRIADLSTFVLKNKTSTFLTYRNAYESRPFNILEELSSSVGIRSTFEFNKEEASNDIIPLVSIGAEAFLENYGWKALETNGGVAGNPLSNNEERRNYLNIFAQSYYGFTSKIKVFAGANLNTTSYQYNDLLKANGVDRSGDYNFTPILSPNLGLSYQFMKPIALFTSISHGFSPPSLEETLNPEGTINPEIGVEKGWNYEIGARGKIAKRITYELTVYTMQVKDLLVARRIAEDQYIGLNAGKTDHSGLEAFMVSEMVKRKKWKLTSFVSYTYAKYRFEEFLDEENDYSGNALTGTPPHLLNAGIDVHSKIGFYGNLTYRFVDAFPIRDDNSIYSDSYQLVRLKFGFKTSLMKKLELNTTVGIDNVYDEKYASMILINAGSFGNNPPRYYYPGLPRNYYASLSLKYSI